MSDEIFILKNIAGILVAGFIMIYMFASMKTTPSTTMKFWYQFGAFFMMVLIGIRGLLVSFGT